MTVTQSALDRWAVACRESWEMAAHAAMMLHRGETQQANEFIRRAMDTSQETYQALVRAGAASVTTISASSPIPLHLLSTPASRALLEGLRYVATLAEAVDAERGHVLPEDFPLQPGESRGTGWAETLSELALRLQIEVEGPKGRE